MSPRNFATVRAAALLGSVLAGCSTLEGTVLVVRELATDAAIDSERDAQAFDGGAFEGGAFAEDAAAREDARARDGGEGDASDGGASLLSACRVGGASDGFFEEFNGDALDAERLLIAHGNVSVGGRTTRGGFLRDNVAVQDGALVLRVRGDGYNGTLRGTDMNGALRSDGRRTAAAVATRDLFASATYYAALQLRGPPGIELGLYVLRDGDAAESLEIAGTSLESAANVGVRVSMRSRTRDGGGGASELALAPSSDGRALHSLRFDWYTNPSESVRFWVDDEARVSSDQRAPSGQAARMWLVAWVPDGQPADFDSAEVRIERAFITPFANSGDRCTPAPVPATLLPP